MSKKNKKKSVSATAKVVGYALFESCDGFGNDAYLVTAKLFNTRDDAQDYYNKFVTDYPRRLRLVSEDDIEDDIESVCGGACIVEMIKED